ncbi:MAG TPA: aminodeoxychorismate lyase [Lacisediminihabitans sp.]|jgi:4-amino-4-deoxychorismate lyase|nr:aminodeoxychorismate lyase [Lacisediminihabitans sp.]HXD60693.1 aminodeoxychorismate lyase [Lacisediminihabitans sp.]
MEAPTLVLITRPVHHDPAKGSKSPSAPGVAIDVPVHPDGFVIADPHSPRLRVLDLGATRGDGIFETVAVTGGRAHALDAHLERFAASARLLDLPEPDARVWRPAIDAAIADHAPVPELSVKLVLTRGIEGTEVPTAWVYAETAPDYRAVRVDGIRVVTLDRGYRHDVAATSPWLLQGAKTLSYAVNRAALREAARRGADDVVFVSSDGYLLEGPTSTLLLQNGNRVSTPRTDQGILAGTTQASAFEFFERAGLETAYDLLPVEELARADAAWLVSSVRQAAPVRAVDGAPLAVDDALTARLNEFLLGEAR